MKNETTEQITILEKKINDGIELTHEDYLLLLTIKLLKTRNG
jgi:hypothetical protein